VRDRHLRAASFFGHGPRAIKSGHKIRIRCSYRVPASLITAANFERNVSTLPRHNSPCGEVSANASPRNYSFRGRRIMVASRGAANAARCIRAGAWRARHEQEEKGPSFVGEVLMAQRKTRRRQCRSGCRVGAGGYGPGPSTKITLDPARTSVLITNDYLAYCEIRVTRQLLVIWKKRQLNEPSQSRWTFTTFLLLDHVGAYNCDFCTSVGRDVGRRKYPQ